MRVIRYRIITKRFERRSGAFLDQTVRECATAGGAAAILWQRPIGTSLPNNPHSRVLSKTTLEIGNGRGWIEYDPNIYQPVDKLKADLIHAADLHCAFYDDGEGRKGVDGI